MINDIAIIGGGIGGVLACIKLNDTKDYKITIFEKENELLSGPPYCHLHSGGFLYPLLPLDECKELLVHSLLFADFFDDCIIKRPTIIAYRRDEPKYNTISLLEKCEFIQKEYSRLNNLILGPTNEYFAVYNKYDMEFCKKNGYLPKNHDSLSRKKHDIYVTQFCKNLHDINIIKYPFVSVNEYGINQEKVKYKVNDYFIKNKNITVYKNYNVNHVEKYNTKWLIDEMRFDYLINSCGYKIDEIRPKLIKDIPDAFLEMKSSWMIKSKIDIDYIFPEIAIIGERSTERGMIQITPHTESNIFQVHLMTNYSTLFDNNRLLLDENEIIIRTNKTIEEISNVFPIFKNSVYYTKPMFGIQRIANVSKEKRADDVTFYNHMYAEIQIVKGISSVFCANKIYNYLKKLN